ncbi:UNVERIFIED_CONTAM: hypothetical protein PYX00_001374 [Menopon gallinae]|uniref:Epoxide hydrolase n=1 Tax=Menopon gallinae TaxID=328185 RepID=A0AAW2IEL0_9NEOP
MNGIGKIVLISSLIGIVSYFGLKCGSCIFRNSKAPEFKEDVWWGPGEPAKLSESISPFRIEVPDKIIQDLNQRLDRYLSDSPTPPLENQGFQYGFNTNYLKEVIKYWRNKYQWKKRQEFIQQYPHFKTFVNGLDIHFLVAKPQATAGKKVLPLLMLHGWPSSFREFLDIIPKLTTPSPNTDFVFHVVVPSLPGYGFSAGSSKPGMGPAEIAVVMKNLMIRLGFNKFYVQGTDWGSIIASNMGILFPDSVLGIHSNMCYTNSPMSYIKWFLGSFWPSLIAPEKYHDKLYPMKNVFFHILKESGYMHLQATKPDTIGTALNDTPVGLAAYILEKFSTWTNMTWRELPDGGLTKKFTLDTLLDNVMIYWISGCITTSQRLYYEAFTSDNQKMERVPVIVPTICARFPNELLWQSTSQLQDKYTNLLQVNDFDVGGHFPALEEPTILSKDIFSAVKMFEDYHAKRNQSGIRT